MPRTSDAFILGLLNAIPDREITGKKRLQKLVHLLKTSGSELEADFRILHYGPFSSDIAQAADVLTFLGRLHEESVSVGSFNISQSNYSIPEGEDCEESLEENEIDLVQKLNEFDTISLEVASTIAFYMDEGCPYEDALNATKELKPKKTIPPIVRKADTILGLVGKT